MGLKKLYYNLEDKYYSFVERTGLYKITDKIDKVMPSFILFLLLIVIIISGLVFLLLPSGGVKDAVEIQFKVIDAESGAFLEDVSIMISTVGGIVTANTSDDGLTEVLKIPRNSSYRIDVVEDAYEKYNNEYVSKDYFETITLALEPIVDQPLLVDYSFRVINSKTKQVLNENGSVSFKCANVAPAPQPMNVTSGEISFKADPTCDLWIDAMSFNGYDSIYDKKISTMTPSVELVPSEINFSDDDFTVVFNVKNSSSEALSNIKVILTNSFGVVDSKTTSSTGSVTFENVEKGEYTVNFSDSRAVPVYSSLSKPYYISSDLSQSIVLSSDVKGYIYVRISGQNASVLENAEVSLKNTENNVLETKLSDEDGDVVFTVSEIKDYNVVVDAEGYLIERKLIKSKETMPSNPTVIPLTLITPQTLASLNVKVTTWDGKPFKFAKVVLYDTETGFLTDYKPVLTNYDGNAVINISSGKYIAKAVKGSVTGESSEFEFNVKFPDLSGTITIPMGISEGILNVSTIDNDGNPVANTRIDLYDRYSYFNFTPAVPLKSVMTNELGMLELVVDADVEYYVVATDYLGDVYGKTQSRFVYVGADTQNSLEVTLYPKNSSTSKPRMVFNGIYKDDLKVEDNLKAGEDYKIRYNFLVPQNRTGDDVFEEIGFMLRTGSTSMIENDSLFIKYLDVPYLNSIQKYTQYNLNAPHESEGFSDEDSLTEGDFKWAKATLKEGPTNYTGGYGFYNTYEIEAIISVKDTTVFGEELKIFSLGYGVNQDDEYETYNQYLGPNEEVEYFDVYDQITFGVGDELLCSDQFCFSSNIIDISEDLRYDVTNDFAVMPNKSYKYSFTLINNSKETKFLSSRFILENVDEGLDFKNIKIIKPNGEVYTQNNTSEHEFDIPITQLLAKQKVTGEIIFMPKLKGTRELSIKFISDQKIKFINNLLLSVSSDKVFDVDVKPSVIPAGKMFSLVVNAKDSVTSVPVNDTTITIKDKFKDIIKGPITVPNSTDEIVVGNIPAQGTGDVVYVYVTAPEYETVVTEIKATDKLYNIIPRNLAYSLNIFEEKQRTESFTINNLSPIDLTIEEMVVKGNGLEVVDLHRINNTLVNSVGVVIKGYDSVSDLPDNTDTSKVIPLTISLNPRSETIREMVNLSSTLHVVLSNGENEWVSEVPIKINIGFDGMIDNSNCLTLSEEFWKGVSLSKPVDTTFVVSNRCSINGKEMPLSNGLEARVVFESNPQGKFTLGIANSSIELTHGNYRRLLDTFDRDHSLPVVLKYEPVGRMKGTVKGTIEFRSVNNTGSGDQEIVSSIAFEIDVINLKDCTVFSKSTLNVGQAQDEFTIENVACPTTMVYNVSCDDCQGLIVEPKRDLEVSTSGTSESIVVRNMGATPGAYILNVYSSMKEFRDSKEIIKKIKVYVRPQDYCVDLERYEFDLYRSQYSESTGLELNATSYDTTNIINLCYGQEVEGTFSVKEDAKWKMAFVSFFREGLYTAGISGILQGKIFASAADKGNKLLESVKDNSDPKVQAAASVLSTAIAGGDKGKIKEATKALEAAVEDKSKDAPEEEVDSQTTDDKSSSIENANDLIAKVKSIEIPIQMTSTQSEAFNNLTKLTSNLTAALDGKDISKISQAYDKLKKAYDKYIVNYSLTFDEAVITEEKPDELNLDSYKQSVLANPNKLDFNGNTYEAENYSNWEDFRKKYDDSVIALNLDIDNLHKNFNGNQSDFAAEVRDKTDEWKNTVNQLISDLNKIEGDALSITDKRLNLARNAITGSNCDSNSKIEGSDDFLFNIRDIPGDDYVYVCSGSKNYRSCVNGKWTRNYKYTEIEGSSHPVQVCENIN